MTPESFTALTSSGLLPSSYASQAQQIRRTWEARVRHLLTQVRDIANGLNQCKKHLSLFQRKLPSEGWSDDDISSLLSDLSRMDSNNFPANCGVGEREARIHSGNDNS